MPCKTAALCSGGRSLNLKSLARLDADPGELGPDLLVFRRWRHELEGEREITGEVFLNPLTGGREEIDLRRGLLEVCGKRLHLVSRLHLLHVWHVFGIE